MLVQGLLKFDLTCKSPGKYLPKKQFISMTSEETKMELSAKIVNSF